MLTTHYLEEAETLCGRIAMLKSGRIVALDSTINLLRKLHHMQLRLKLDGCPPATLNGRNLVARGSEHILQFSDVMELEPILTELRISGVRLLEVEVEKPDLEDVFLDILGEQ